MIGRPRSGHEQLAEILVGSRGNSLAESPKFELGNENAISQSRSLTRIAPSVGEAYFSSADNFRCEPVHQPVTRWVPYFTDDAFKFCHSLSQL